MACFVFATNRIRNQHNFLSLKFLLCSLAPKQSDEKIEYRGQVFFDLFCVALLARYPKDELAQNLRQSSETSWPGQGCKHANTSWCTKDWPRGEFERQYKNVELNHRKIQESKGKKNQYLVLICFFFKKNFVSKSHIDSTTCQRCQRCQLRIWESPSLVESCHLKVTNASAWVCKALFCGSFQEVYFSYPSVISFLSFLSFSYIVLINKMDYIQINN